jgi:SAM-dependent methyltransferase
MEIDSANRFTSRVEAYARFRPSYPRQALDSLQRECRLTPASKIADIGSGTGLLASLFLEFGCEVFGVEPNAKMREAAQRSLANEASFHVVDGQAEATTLPGESVDFVTAGQAFHWFEPAAARKEFQRILRPGGWVVLIWNEWAVTPGFMTELDVFLRRFVPENQHPSEDEFTAFYGHPDWRLTRIPNRQSLDEDGLRGRVESSSWSPLPGADSYREMQREIRRLFREYRQEGRVTIEYETRIYYGQL